MSEINKKEDDKMVKIWTKEDDDSVSMHGLDDQSMTANTHDFSPSVDGDPVPLTRF